MDGHNALHRLRLRSGNHERDRRALLSRVRAVDPSAIVFFDARGAAPDLPSVRQQGGLRVRYCRGREADAAILDEVRRSDRPADLVVVTDDSEVAGSARQLGARTSTVAAFFEPPRGRPATEPDPPRGGPGGFRARDFGLPDHVDLDEPPPGIEPD